MANLTQYLTSISPDLRSGSPPGRRLLALVLCSMLILASISPGVALAGEADSEGEGTSPQVELPEPPDFDPGGEETGLEEEVPATGGGEEEGTVEIEPKVDTAAPPPEEVTSAATEAPVEAPSPPPVTAPESATSAPESEPVQQQVASEPASTQPVANQSITAPKQTTTVRHSASASVPANAAPPADPAPQEAPPSQLVAVPPADSGRSLAGKDSYVVQPGDCLWHIAAGLLPGNAAPGTVAREVARLWLLNEDRIGTGNPNLIYAGTELQLR